MAYFEGEIPTVTSGNNGGMWGNDGIWAILLLALLGFGNRGYGFGGGGGNGVAEGVGYELGKLATTNDVASGFSTNGIIATQRESQLASQQGFANVQQSLCQGFSGINTAILQNANANERGFANLGYNMANCCCETKSAIADVKYANEKQTSEILLNQNNNTQRILDYLCNEKIDTLNRKLATAENEANQLRNNAYLINQLKPCPVPAYITCNPATGLTYPNVNTSNCNGCGF